MQYENLIQKLLDLGIEEDIHTGDITTESIIPTSTNGVATMTAKEDGVISGGAGSAIIEFMAANGYSPTIRCIGIPDTFVEHGTTEQLYEICGMDKDTVLRTILQMKKQ